MPYEKVVVVDADLEPGFLFYLPCRLSLLLSLPKIRRGGGGFSGLKHGNKSVFCIMCPLMAPRKIL